MHLHWFDNNNDDDDYVLIFTTLSTISFISTTTTNIPSAFFETELKGCGEFDTPKGW
jgi:hypothetical protein